MKYLYGVVILSVTLVLITCVHHTSQEIIPKTEVINLVKPETLFIQGFLHNGEAEEGTNLLNLSSQIQERVKADVKHINLVFDSPGGMVFPGQVLKSTMIHSKGRGVTFTCIIDGLAGRMALSIYTECDHRYAVFGSKVMWHSAGRMYIGRVNEGWALDTYKRFHKMNETLWNKTKKYFSEEYFKYHFDNETVIDVSEINKESNYLVVIHRLIIKEK